MTGTHYLSGSQGFMRNILRYVIFAAATVGGLFLFIASAAVAFFVVAGIVIIGFLAFVIMWTRAKVLGRPFGPQAQFEKARADMEAHFKSQTKESGPIIDAHRTPHGWSVDD